MLTCGGCRVARFCSADHQKMASKNVASGGGLLHCRHKDVCGVLGKWRQQVVKDGISPDSCRSDLLAFLQQGRWHVLYIPPGQIASFLIRTHGPSFESNTSQPWMYLFIQKEKGSQNKAFLGCGTSRMSG